MVLSTVLLASDQVTKFLAGWLLAPTTTEQWNECYPTGADCAARLADVRIAFNWGLTYTEHAGFWLWGDLHGSVAVALFVVVLAVWAGVLVAARGYRRWYRSSMPVDLATAWVTLAVWGHLIDRLLLGVARDWLVTPIGVANLPDMAVWPALLLCAVELWRYPPARRLLHPDPRRWRPPTPTATRRPGPRRGG